SRVVVQRVLTVLLLVFGIYQTVSLAFTTPLLRVSEIAVHGNVRLSSGQVQALVEDLRGTSILQVDLDAFRRRLIESPWVADVALRRLLPSTIEVFVAERRPVGLCRLGQGLYLVDETGVIIDQFGPQYAEFDLPIIDGAVNAPAGRNKVQDSIDPRRAELASRVIASLARDQAIFGRLSEVDVTDVHDAVVLLDGDTALLHLGVDRFLERVQGYLEISSTLRDRVAEIDYVDLRFDERVYVRPAGGQRRRPATRQERGPATRQF
ncbi:MAG: cell division protein FtsQ/DivIB, partial [Vicinamibacterales bacterium]